MTEPYTLFKRNNPINLRKKSINSGNNPDKKPSNLRRRIHMVAGGLFGLGIAFLLSVQLQMIITQAYNHGVPRAYGFSLLYVASNSMEGDKEDSLSVGTGILVQKVDPAGLAKGDIVTFFDVNISALNTHRLCEDPHFDGETHQFHTMGDNYETPYFPASYMGEFFTTDELIGKVIAHNDALGTVLGHVSPAVSGVATNHSPFIAWFVLSSILLPLAGVMTFALITTIMDLRHEIKAEKNDEENKN